jgi:anaerobic magnesium-protoporphyrin IX monomethyl ester cyclase
MALKILLALPIREGENLQIAPDLGLLYLGTALRTHGHRITLLDCPKEGFTYHDFKRFVHEGNFDVVGMRCFSRDHNYVNHHLNIVKHVSPKALTLAGGPHPSALPAFVLEGMPALDFAWQSEAEDSLPLLLQYFEDYGIHIPEDLLATIPGLIRRQGNEVLANPAGYTRDLDAFGLPAWEMLDPTSYPGVLYREHYPIVTTRGCPYPCTYCNTPRLSGRRLRHRSVDHVIEELRLLKARYGAGRFTVYDDEFTLNRKYAYTLCQTMIDKGLDMKWDSLAGVRLDSLDPELLRVMEASGCEALSVGIESGNERVQKAIRKQVTVETIRKQVEMMKGCSKIKIMGYFMIGFLDETEAEIVDTIKLALQLPLHRANFNIVIPIPGTALFDELVRFGKVRLQDINWDECNVDQITFERDGISGRRLQQLRRGAYLRFYGRPRIMWELSLETLSNREVLRAVLRKLQLLFSRRERGEFRPLYLKQAQMESL